MITNGILLVFQGVLNILLLSLAALNVAIDFIGSIPVVTQFLQVVVYVLPWDNLKPLIIFTIAMFTFRAILSLIKLIWHFIPIAGN